MNISVDTYADSLKQQRNNALDEAAMLRAQVITMADQISKLEQTIKELTPKPQEEKPKLELVEAKEAEATA